MVASYACTNDVSVLFFED
uniref:Uncharacterized protein n=1 Tax=Arundo donax TaxID=35708 RepID=A0A0A8ZF82_ARUDO